MRNIKMVVEYDGSRYLGWQRQPNTERTIQGKLESVIQQMVGADVDVIGSGRTDAGVHAHGQVANFHGQTDMSAEQIHQYLNQYLPQDIAVLVVEEAPERFHARYNAKAKKYVYRIWNHWIPSAFERKYSLHLPEPLDVPAMEEASRLLVGTHDFLPFSSLRRSKKSTVRTISSVDFEQTGSMLEISIIGNGFLYNMVRILTGTLIEVGQGKQSPDCIPGIFGSGKRQEAGYTVPPHGLFLAEVYY